MCIFEWERFTPEEANQLADVVLQILLEISESFSIRYSVKDVYKPWLTPLRPVVYGAQLAAKGTSTS
jgi:hypothetical protein